jgi:hypothetical protein
MMSGACESRGEEGTGFAGKEQIQQTQVPNYMISIRLIVEIKATEAL